MREGGVLGVLGGACSTPAHTVLLARRGSTVVVWTPVGGGQQHSTYDRKELTVECVVPQCKRTQHRSGLCQVCVNRVLRRIDPAYKAWCARRTRRTKSRLAGHSQEWVDQNWPKITHSTSGQWAKYTAEQRVCIATDTWPAQ